MSSRNSPVGPTGSAMRLTSVDAHTPPPHYEYQPPSYEESACTTTCSKLPTYEDFEKAHEDEDEYPTHIPVDGVVLPDYETAYYIDGSASYADPMLGDNATFLCAFVVAFFLNWIGFVAILLYSRTVAGRCGATAGFGLSLIKVAFLLRTASSPEQPPAQSEENPDIVSESDSYWICIIWVLILFGWLIFLRGTTVYLRHRRQLIMLFPSMASVA